MAAINTPTYMRLRDLLRADIVAGVWPLGAHVTLAQLAQHYEVSNAPVREALLQLQGEGVVAMRMNRGAVIPLVDERYIDELYRVRGALQTMLAREAALRAGVAQVDQMMERAADYEAAAHAADVDACLQANRAFHRCIDGIAANNIAADLLQGRSSLVDAFRHQVGYGQGRLDLVVQQHRRLADAIAAGDAEEAARAALDHTDSARLDLIAMARALVRA